MNEGLAAAATELRAAVASLEKKLKDEREEWEAKVEDLGEQVRDLMVFIEAGKAIREADKGEREGGGGGSGSCGSVGVFGNSGGNSNNNFGDAAGGTVLPLPPPPPPPEPVRRGGKSRRGGGRR